MKSINEDLYIGEDGNKVFAHYVSSLQVATIASYVYRCIIMMTCVCMYIAAIYKLYG